MDVICQACNYLGVLVDNCDGYFSCDRCGYQVEDMMKTELDEYNHQGLYTANALRRRCYAYNPYHDGNNQVKIESTDDGIGLSEPQDFGKNPWPYKEEENLRMSYVMGLQIMLQLQTKAMVEKFKVSPLICGIAGEIWLRYVASTEVFDDTWANKVITKSESMSKGIREEFKPRAKHSSESFNIHGKRAVMLWYSSLSKMIPLSGTLVITYLACHLVREAVLPTDLVKWSLEGKLPYFVAFIEIEKELRAASNLFPIGSSSMFRPSESISSCKLEMQAASIAQKIGLELPPVNFYAIASRYLKQLSLNMEKIIASVIKVYEWSMPSELWLSASETSIPTRVCVLSMVIVAIRIMYNIHGFGFWEKSFSIDLSTGKALDKPSDTADASIVDSSDIDAMKLLRHLEEKYDELEETYEYSKNFPAYLDYCKDVVFAGMGPSHKELEEEKLIEELWNYYQAKEESSPTTNHDSNGLRQPKQSTEDDEMNLAKKRKKSSGNDDSYSNSSHISDSFRLKRDIVSEKENALKRLKLNMNENRFCYIPPRVNVKRLDYLKYTRKKDEGAFTYAAHGDYYILLRSCSRIAKVDVRVMHSAVLIFEKKLASLEEQTDGCSSLLELKEETCKHCVE